MKAIRIYLNEKDKEYLTPDAAACVECEELIEKMMFLSCFKNTGKHLHENKTFCMRCLKKVSKKGLQHYHSIIGDTKSNYLIRMVLESEIPDEAHLVFLNSSTDFSFSKSVFEAVITTKKDVDDGVAVEDSTFLAGRESFGGAVIGVVVADDELIELDKVKDKLKEISKRKRVEPKLVGTGGCE